VNIKDAGFDVTAIEMNHDCVAFLNNTVGVLAIQSDDPAATLANMTDNFDVITLWHSIEHLPHPWDVIRRAAQRLNPGGILLVATPNPDSFEFSLLGGCWVHLDAPRHFYLLPPGLVQTIGSDCGLRMIRFTTNDKLSDILSNYAWESFAASLVPVRFVRGAIRIIGGYILRLIFARQQKMPGRGSAFIVVFERTKVKI
jgi:SAM-dependent methyltransferase